MKRMLTFTIPIWVSMMVNSLLGITDFFFLSAISANYISIVGLAYVPYNLLNSVIVGLGIESNRTKAKNENLNFWYILAFAVASSSILAIIAFFFSDYLLFFSKDSLYFNEIKMYFSILVFSSIPTSVLFVCTGILRGKGIPKKTLYFSMTCVILNFIFDYIFINYVFWDNPLKACAIATIVADFLVAIVYIIYFVIKNYTDFNKMDIYKFIKNSFTISLEKIFSSSTLQVVSSFFLAKIDIAYAAIYFGLERLLQPVQLYSHGYFEWIIYSRSKNIKNIKSIYYYYFGVISLVAIFSSFYLKMDHVAKIYTVIHILYVFLFFVQRATVATYFALEKGKIVNYASLLKNGLFISSLFLLLITKNLSLLSFGVTNLIFLTCESAILQLILWKKFDGKCKTISAGNEI